MRVVFKIVVLVLLMVPLLACALHIANSGQTDLPQRSAGTLRLASHNVHYILLGQQSGAWSVGDWTARKPALDAAFKAIDADVIAFQEMESFARGDDGSVNLALDYLLAENPDYAAAAVGDWRQFPSTQPILYRKAALQVQGQGWFFFSDTPDVIYSRTFNGSYPAFASWVKFAPNAAGAPFYIFNVHFEYKSRSNRRRSAELVRDRILPLIAKGEAVFLVGDLNARLGAPTLDFYEAIGFSFAPVSGSTYHFNRGINLFGAIDHLAATPAVRLVDGPFVVRRQFQGKWPSDHYPVFADYELAQ